MHLPRVLVAWAEIRLSVRKTSFLVSGDGALNNAWFVFEYTRHMATKGLQAKTVGSLLSAAKYYHRVSRGLKLQTTHLLLSVHLLKGAIRGHVGSGNQQRLRMPVSYGLFVDRRADAYALWKWGRVLWLALVASFLFQREWRRCPPRRLLYEVLGVYILHRMLVLSFSFRRWFNSIVRRGILQTGLRFRFAHRRKFLISVRGGSYTMKKRTADKGK